MNEHSNANRDSANSTGRDTYNRAKPVVRSDSKPAMTRTICVYYKNQTRDDVKHWVFGLEDAEPSGKISYNMLYDIVILGSGWTPRATPIRPSTSPRYAGKTALGQISDSRETLSVVKSVIWEINDRIDPKAQNYDCQDYVMEILDGLVQKHIINVKDKNYREGLQELLKRYRK
jgi:hypothetical protein